MERLAPSIFPGRWQVRTVRERPPVPVIVRWTMPQVCPKRESPCLICAPAGYDPRYDLCDVSCVGSSSTSWVGWSLRCPVVTSRTQGTSWTCPLCGSSGPREREDALPSWIRRHAEKQPGGPYVGTAYERPYSGRRPPAFRVPVCGLCNRWMGRTFEEPAQSALVPLLKGYPHTLLPDGQRVIARWTAKSALMQALFDLPEDQALLEVCRTFRATGEPPAGCQVFIGRYADSGRLPSTPAPSPAVAKPPTHRQAPSGHGWRP
jgi:hypothetical protein